MSNKILFLDFDGVITTHASHWKISSPKVIMINEICKETDAKIVVSSSWKHGFKDVSKFIEHIRGKMSLIYHSDNETFYSNIVGLTSSKYGYRGKEIKEYIDENKIVDYVILDDDDDMLDEQLFRFVQTDSYEGITEREVHLCIDVLNHKRIPNPIRLNYILRDKWRDDVRGYESNIKSLLKSYNDYIKSLSD